MALAESARRFNAPATPRRSHAGAPSNLRDGSIVFNLRLLVPFKQLGRRGDQPTTYVFSRTLHWLMRHDQ
jgi:hypothetical protein